MDTKKTFQMSLNLKFLFAFFFIFELICGSATFADVDRVLRSNRVNVAFSKGAEADFVLGSSGMESISIALSNKILTVPASICSKVRAVDFSNVILRWSGKFDKAGEADFVGLELKLLNKTNESVEFIFQNGRFAAANVVTVSGNIEKRDSLK